MKISTLPTLLLPLLVALAAAGEEKVRPGVITPEMEAVLAQAPTGEEVRVLVSFVAQPGTLVAPGGGAGGAQARAGFLRAQQARTAAIQAPLLDRLRAAGARRLVSLWAINGLAATARPEVIRELAARPEVSNIRLDAVIEAPRAESASALSAIAEWNLAMVGAPEMWERGRRGAGVVVAVMDTGVDVTHQALSPSWRGGSNSWFDPNGEHAAPYDGSGHGTQALGVIVGGTTAGVPIGVAPDARWIAVKIFDDSGHASLSAIHSGFQWLLNPDGDPATDDAPDVVSNSWGFGDHVGECYSEFAPDIAALRAAGIAAVFSGGNAGPGVATSVSPANNPGALAVGSVDASSLPDTFGSRGPCACGGTLYPTLVAPGVAVRTTDLTAGGVFPAATTTVSGSSFAAPHVAGALALLRSGHPDATLDQLEAALRQGARDLGAAGPDDDSGYGLLDVPAADEALAELVARPHVPRRSLTRTPPAPGAPAAATALVPSDTPQTATGGGQR